MDGLELIALKMTDEYMAAMARGNAPSDILAAVRPGLDQLVAGYGALHAMVHGPQGAVPTEDERVKAEADANAARIEADAAKANDGAPHPALHRPVLPSMRPVPQR
jgi:hypothetical protein